MSRILNAAREAEDAAYGGIYTLNGAAPAAGPNAAQRTVEFARGGLEHRDGRDELMREKMEFVAQNAGGATPFGEVHATDEDFKWLQRKRDTEAAANLDAWISSQFNSGDVARRKWLQEVYPEFFEVRERQLLDRAKFATRVNLLLLRGPKNEKDLILMWGLQTGQIQLDADWNKIGPLGATVNNGAGAAARFKSGLMDFRRYKTDGERTASATNVANNPFASAPAGPANQSPYPFTDGTAVTSQPNANPVIRRYPAFVTKMGL